MMSNLNFYRDYTISGIQEMESFEVQQMGSGSSQVFSGDTETIVVKESSQQQVDRSGPASDESVKLPSMESRNPSQIFVGEKEDLNVSQFKVQIQNNLAGLIDKAKQVNRTQEDEKSQNS